MSLRIQEALGRGVKKVTEMEVAFLQNARRVKSVVRLIQANTNTNYITHSEVIEHRAEHTRRWAHFRRSLLAGDVKKAIYRRRRGEGGVMVVLKGRAIAGVAVLTFDLKHHYGVVEDIVIDERWRGTGVGHLLLQGALREMREAKMENAILESGIRNESAHRFFERHGFREAAVMFLKHLRTEE